MAGNAKQPGGYAFRTREEALVYSKAHKEANLFAPYEIELPVMFGAATTWDMVAKCDLLVVEAPLVNPDTGEPA
jgi:hypothetical protein